MYEKIEQAFFSVPCVSDLNKKRNNKEHQTHNEIEQAYTSVPFSLI